MGSSEGVGGGAFLVAGAACDRPGVGGRGAEGGGVGGGDEIGKVDPSQIPQGF